MFPVALWTAPSGQTLLAHCPDAFNRIDIDDVDTGQRLTASQPRTPKGLFHSRLAVNPSGTRLLTAGWIWQPWDFVGWFDLDAALRQPSTLDQPETSDGSLQEGFPEEASAAWQTDETLLVGSSDEVQDPEEGTQSGDRPTLGSPGLAVVDVSDGRVLQSLRLSHPPGAMMPVGREAVVTFYEHPRLYRLSDGALLGEWTDLPTGEHTGSAQNHLPPPPPLALDPHRSRFAVALQDEICVVALHGS